jgi:hypothetical protein
MKARTPPRLTGFVTAHRRGSTVVESFELRRRRVSWQGTCIERIEEAFPGANQETPPECLEDAEVAEEMLPSELEVEDVRADHLFGDPAALRRWRSCRQRTPAETCLDRLLPLAGGGAGGDAGHVRWVKARAWALKGSGVVRRKTCRLALADPDSGWLAFRCRGTLVDSACSSKESAWCSGHEMVEIARVDAAPSEACLTAARTALRAPADRFAAARSAALAACAGTSPERFNDGDLGPGYRVLVFRVLARQEALFGPVKLPTPCAERNACKSTGGRTAYDQAQVIAQGCGNQIWALEMSNHNVGTIGNGGWGGYDDDRLLVRLPVGANPRESRDHVYIVDTAAFGNEFNNYQADRDDSHSEAELIEEDCVANQGDQKLCGSYAWGHPIEQGAAPADRRQVEALLARDWPRAWVRLQRWQRDLASGARLRLWEGEEYNETCARLLVDACTGDLGEVCTRRDAPDDTACEGELLPDGRCRQYRFERLPLLPAR